MRFFPVNGTTYKNVSELNYTLSNADSAQNCWYDIGGGNVSVPCGDNISSISPDFGANIWIVGVNNTDGVMNTSSTTFEIFSLLPLRKIYP